VVIGAIEGEQVDMLALFHNARPPTNDRSYYMDKLPPLRFIDGKQSWEYPVNVIRECAIFEAIGRTCSVEVFNAFREVFNTFGSWEIIMDTLASGIAHSKDYSKSLHFIKHLTRIKIFQENGILGELLQNFVDLGSTRLLDALLSPSLKSQLRRHDPNVPLLLNVKFRECKATFDPFESLVRAATQGTTEGFLKSLTFFEEKGIQFDYSDFYFSKILFRMQSIDALNVLEKRVTDPAKLNAMFDEAEIYDIQNPVVPYVNKHLQFHIYLTRRFADKIKGVSFKALLDNIILEDPKLVHFLGESAVPMVEFLSVFVELGSEIPNTFFEDIIYGHSSSKKFSLTPLLRFFVENEKVKISLPPTKFTNALFRNPSSFEEASDILVLYLKRFSQVDLASVLIVILELPLEEIASLMGHLDVFIVGSSGSVSNECYSSFIQSHRKPPNDVEQFKVIMLWLIKHTQSLNEIPLDVLLIGVSDSRLLNWIMSRQDLFRFGESNYVTFISRALAGLSLGKTTNMLLDAIPVTEIISKIELLRNANVPYSESLISEVLDAMDVSTDGVSDHFEDDLLVVIEYARKELKCAWDEKVGRAAIPYGKFPKIFTHFLWEKCPIHACSCRSCSR